MPLKRTLSTPVKTPRKLKIYKTGTPVKVKPRVYQVKSSAAKLIENSEYKRAFSVLYNGSGGAQKAFKHLLQCQIRKEIYQLLNTGCCLDQPCNMDSIRGFSWESLLEDLRRNTPLLYTAIDSAITSRRSESDMICPTTKRSLIPTMGMVLSMLLHMRRPTQFKLIQGVNSIELWKSGAQRKVFDHFNRIGFCMGRKGTMTILSNIKVEADADLLNMKRSIETQRVTEDTESEETSATSIAESSSESKSQSDTEAEAQEEIETESISEQDSDNTDSPMAMTLESENSEEDTCPGYTLVWDNVGKELRARHQNTQKQNKMLLWALAYAAKNRIPTTGFRDETTVEAETLPIETFLPGDNDLKEVKTRMKEIIKRIITTHIPFLKDNFSSVVKQHIRHRHWKLSSQKSTVINLGVMQEDPCTIAGTIRILEDLHKYVPITEGKVHTIACFGDGLSCERHNDAHKARSNGETQTDRLEGLQPCAQEFHKRMLLMQDAMDIFFKGSSLTEKGTLCHLKNNFGHRNVKQDVGNCFNHVADFMTFVTSAYTVLAAMHFLEMEDASKELMNWDEVDGMSEEDKIHFLDDVAGKILDMVWQDLGVADVIRGGPEKPYIYCICATDLGDDAPMIECSATSCERKWFHLECVDLTEESVPEGDWFCCESCRLSLGRYQYCLCKQDKGSSIPMIGCDNNACPRGSWFHYECVGIGEESVPAGDWFCSESCKSPNKEDQDFVKNYVTALMWWGLLDLARRDAVRENDGPAMMSHWKFDMIGFHNRNHHKYVILGHRLIAAISGWLPLRLQQDLIWNRTVNLTGGTGKSIEMDLVNEFLNREFKESLKDAAGNVTPETVARHSKLIGHMSRDLDNLYSEKLLCRDDIREFRRARKLDITKDVQLFLTMMEKENVFKYTAGRQYRSFPNFSFQAMSRAPERLNKKISQLSKRLDRNRRICQR